MMIIIIIIIITITKFSNLIGYQADMIWALTEQYTRHA